MNCTEKQYIDTIESKHPGSFYLRLIDPLMLETWIFTYTLYKDYLHCSKLDFHNNRKMANWAWSAGSVQIDSTGLFINKTFPTFTFPISTTFTLPTSVPSGTTYKISYGGRTIDGIKDCEVTINIEHKCCCGSASVGSNRHSGYCPLYKENQ